MSKAKEKRPFHKKYGGRLDDDDMLTIMTARHVASAVCELSYVTDVFGTSMIAYPGTDDTVWYPVLRFMCTRYSRRITRITWTPIVGRDKPRMLPEPVGSMIAMGGGSHNELSVRNDEAPRYLYGVTLECLRKFRPDFKKAVRWFDATYDATYDRNLIIDPDDGDVVKYSWSPLGDKAYDAELKAKGKKSGYCSQ